MKKHYFLLGSQDLLRAFHISVYDALRICEEGEEFKLVTFKDGEDPGTLIYETQGWNEYATLTETEYEQFSKIEVE